MREATVFLQTCLFKLAEELWAVLGGVGSGGGVVPAQPAIPVPAAVQTCGTEAFKTRTDRL